MLNPDQYITTAPALPPEQLDRLGSDIAAEGDGRFHALVIDSSAPGSPYRGSVRTVHGTGLAGGTPRAYGFRSADGLDPRGNNLMHIDRAGLFLRVRRLNPSDLPKGTTIAALAEEEHFPIPVLGSLFSYGGDNTIVYLDHTGELRTTGVWVQATQLAQPPVMLGTLTAYDGMAGRNFRDVIRAEYWPRIVAEPIDHEHRDVETGSRYEYLIVGGSDRGRNERWTVGWASRIEDDAYSSGVNMWVDHHSSNFVTGAMLRRTPVVGEEVYTLDGLPGPATVVDINPNFLDVHTPDGVNGRTTAWVRLRPTAEAEAEDVTSNRPNPESIHNIPMWLVDPGHGEPIGMCGEIEGERYTIPWTVHRSMMHMRQYIGTVQVARHGSYGDRYYRVGTENVQVRGAHVRPPVGGAGITQYVIGWDNTGAWGYGTIENSYRTVRGNSITILQMWGQNADGEESWGRQYKEFPLWVRAFRSNSFIAPFPAPDDTEEERARKVADLETNTILLRLLATVTWESWNRGWANIATEHWSSFYPTDHYSELYAEWRWDKPVWAVIQRGGGAPEVVSAPFTNNQLTSSNDSGVEGMFNTQLNPWPNVTHVRDAITRQHGCRWEEVRPLAIEERAILAHIHAGYVRTQPALEDGQTIGDWIRAKTEAVNIALAALATRMAWCSEYEDTVIPCGLTPRDGTGQPITYVTREEVPPVVTAPEEEEPEERDWTVEVGISVEGSRDFESTGADFDQALLRDTGLDEWEMQTYSSEYTATRSFAFTITGTWEDSDDASASLDRYSVRELIANDHDVYLDTLGNWDWEVEDCYEA